MKAATVIENIRQMVAPDLVGKLKELKERRPKATADLAEAQSRVEDARARRRQAVADGLDPRAIEKDLSTAAAEAETLKSRAEDLDAAIGATEAALAARERDLAIASLEERVKRARDVGADAGGKILSALAVVQAECSRLFAAAGEELDCAAMQARMGFPVSPSTIPTVPQLVENGMSEALVRKVYPWFRSGGGRMNDGQHFDRQIPELSLSTVVPDFPAERKP